VNLQAVDPDDHAQKSPPDQETLWLTSLDGLVKKRKVSTTCGRLLHPLYGAYPQIYPQAMKIKPEQVDRLSALLLKRYRDKELIDSKALDADIKTKIAAVISANFAEEEAIEGEVRQMLAAHAGATRDMDPYKMFLIAKQKLAAKKGFIL